MTFRWLAVLYTSFLLAGCSQFSTFSPLQEKPKCFAPGSTQQEKCYYLLEITGKNNEDGSVSGIVAVEALKKNKEDNKDFDVEQYPRKEQIFNFYARECPDLQPGSVYSFDSVPGQRYLVCRKA